MTITEARDYQPPWAYSMTEIRETAERAIMEKVDEADIFFAEAFVVDIFRALNEQGDVHYQVFLKAGYKLATDDIVASHVSDRLHEAGFDELSVDIYVNDAWVM